MKLRHLTAASLLAGVSCAKVPIYDVNAGFTLADASWFAEEETLFIFYEVSAEQGLGDPSVVEISYATDNERVPWTVITELPTVHTHLDVDCGATSLCGSASLHVPIEPREFAIRLRYHRDGELALDTEEVFNVVDLGPPHSHRSLIVYGVFDETNQRVQWRSRHQFPTLRNHHAEDLGLRRDFSIYDQRYGTAEIASEDNPYGYGGNCPGSFDDAYTDPDLDEVQTRTRAVFNAADLPLDASDEAMVCARATVTDATGTFTTAALAQKNPEVRSAFPVLRSPIHDANQIQFFLEPCNYNISPIHEEMQYQRLLFTSPSRFCIDDWRSDGFADALAVALTDAIEAQRPSGEDMVLVIGLHRDEIGVADVVEEALAKVVPEERHRSSPRLAGAFVFDSFIHGLGLEELEPVAMWCPATLPTGVDIPDASSIYCAILPDNPEFKLGPLSFGALPILPSREQYLDFIDTYSESQAGEVLTLRFLTPEFATTSDHTDLGDYGVVTFLNNEIISSDWDDAFSYCPQEELQYFMFRSEFMQSEVFAALIAKKCEDIGLSEDICAYAALGLLPLEMLPDWHNLFVEDTYDLGLFWEFPYLLRMEYEAVAAGSASAFGLSIPFGFGTDGEAYYGTQVWTTDEFSLDEILTQCRRFCDHPTFDSAGVYHVTDPFRDTYSSSCYLPVYPVLGDSGFPRDP